ncbi:MAG: nucleotidyltransferase domain-containing protein [Acidobacteriota bacterium]
MTRDEILRVIAVNRPHLVSLGVCELALFGSYARGDAGPDSDVDFIVDLVEKSFDRYMELKEFLEELLGRKVDLVLKGAIKSRMRERILREAVRAA